MSSHGDIYLRLAPLWLLHAAVFLIFVVGSVQLVIYIFYKIYKYMYVWIYLYIYIYWTTVTATADWRFVWGTVVNSEELIPANCPRYALIQWPVSRSETVRALGPRHPARTRAVRFPCAFQGSSPKVEPTDKPFKTISAVWVWGPNN